MLLKDITAKLDITLKPNLAYEWDNVGLCIGELSSEVKTALVTLEINEFVIQEAIEKKADLIISHHPLIFKPIKTVIDSELKGSMILKLIKNSINVYVAHTNFDILEGGLNDYVASLIGLKNVDKLAFDNEEGIGRYGILSNPMSLDEFADYIKTKLEIDNLRLIDGGNKIISKVGLVTGSGIEYATDAFRLDCDVYLTGDIKYHDAQDWLLKGMNIIDIGHYGSEIHFRENMINLLEKEIDSELVYLISDALKDPFRAV